mmetsp:Transcript_49504/g.123086  ORF Transcript_49504/g.123086 Transcript_49504/m.123086 type:complete len:225 (-) Transcript_49504:212-886(-)
MLPQRRRQRRDAGVADGVGGEVEACQRGQCAPAEGGGECLRATRPQPVVREAQVLERRHELPAEAGAQRQEAHLSRAGELQPQRAQLPQPSGEGDERERRHVRRVEAAAAVEAFRPRLAALVRRLAPPRRLAAAPRRPQGQLAPHATPHEEEAREQLHVAPLPLQRRKDALQRRAQRFARAAQLDDERGRERVGKAAADGLEQLVGHIGQPEPHLSFPLARLSV